MLAVAVKIKITRLTGALANKFCGRMADEAGECGVKVGPTGESVVSVFFVTIALCRAVINFGSLKKQVFNVARNKFSVLARPI